MNSNFRLVKVKIIFCCLLFNISIASLSAQISSDSLFYSIVTDAIIDGNADDLSNLFHSKVELTLPGQNNIYSKQQAKFILKDFFLKDKPTSFNLVTQNKIDDSSFIVGKLHTTKKHYRVCFLTKTINNVIYIYQIRIEE